MIWYILLLSVFLVWGVLIFLFFFFKVGTLFGVVCVVCVVGCGLWAPPSPPFPPPLSPPLSPPLLWALGKNKNLKTDFDFAGCVAFVWLS